MLSDSEFPVGWADGSSGYSSVSWIGWDIVDSISNRVGYFTWTLIIDFLVIDTQEAM